MAGFRFNVIGHGQILYVDEGVMIRMIMPDIKGHSRVFGDPMKNGSCEQRNLDPIRSGKYTLQIDPEPRNSMKLSQILRIHPGQDDCGHLFLLNNLLKPHVDDHCIDIWIPKPENPADIYGKASLRLYSEPVIPDNRHVDAALKSNGLLHDVICFSYENVKSVVFDGHQRTLQAAATLCFYSEPLNLQVNKLRTQPHQYGLDAALEWTDDHSQPRYNFTPSVFRYPDPFTNLPSGILPCHLISLPKLPHVGTLNDDSGCIPAFLGLE